MPRTQSFTQSQLRKLRSEMEEDFARLLRSMTIGEASGSPSANEAWSTELQSEPDEMDVVLHDRAQNRLAAITAALRRFDSGAYGECARCGSRIGFGRLAVMPEATLCIACEGN